ncbi:MAG: OmpA family protein, partial [Thermodesulfobacteriota bacterium]
LTVFKQVKHQKGRCNMKEKNSLIKHAVLLNGFLLFVIASFALILLSGCYPQVPAQTPTEPTVDDTQPGVEITEGANQLRIQIDGDLLFDFDKAAIQPSADPVLEKVADVIRQYPDAFILIDGHTDSKGPDDYNLDLSDRRAVAVKDWLMTKGGVVKATMTTRGWGEAKPIATNTNPDGSDNPEGRRQNRRVEIIVQK